MISVKHERAAKYNLRANITDLHLPYMEGKVKLFYDEFVDQASIPTYVKFGKRIKSLHLSL
jgi:hypothetical protein